MERKIKPLIYNVMHGHSDCREEEKKSEFIKTNQTEFNNMVHIPQP
jgi:hypothetical protein